MMEVDVDGDVEAVYGDAHVKKVLSSELRGTQTSAEFRLEADSTGMSGGPEERGWKHAKEDLT